MKFSLFLISLSFFHQTHQATEPPDDITDVLKALNLPIDFSQWDNETDSTSSPQIPKFKISTLYMSGSPKLDRILNCPCKRYQLDELGITGFPVQSKISDPGQIQNSTKKVLKKIVIKKIRPGSKKTEEKSTEKYSWSFFQPIISGFKQVTTPGRRSVVTSQFIPTLTENLKYGSGRIVNFFSSLISSNPLARRNFGPTFTPQPYRSHSQSQPIPSGSPSPPAPQATEVVDKSNVISPVVVDKNPDFKWKIRESIKNDIRNHQQIQTPQQRTSFTSGNA